MKKIQTVPTLISLLAALIFLLAPTGCTLKFNDISVPPEIKTIRIQQFDNQAAYINPRLSPGLTERLRQKIVSQTKLTQTNNEDAQMNITGIVREYSITTTGISTNSTTGQKQTTVNRLTVAVQVYVTKPNDTGQPEEILVSRSFDFGANLSIQAAENQLLDEMVRNLTDEIFNRIFSKW